MGTNGKPSESPTIIIQIPPGGGVPIIKSNLADPLAIAAFLGHASAAWAEHMARVRHEQMQSAVVMPDGSMPPTDLAK